MKDGDYMPTWKYLYTCNQTGMKVYTNGICNKIIHANGKIDSDAIRNYCIRNNYYTHGNNEEYSNLLLNLCKEDKNITVNHLEKIALDIMEHSNLETIYKCYNCTEDELKSNIMFELNKECCDTFFK